MRIDFQRPFVAPEGAVDVLLVRHGSADPPHDASGLVGGRSDPGLNDAGRAQAERAAERLVQLGVGAAVTSWMRRARETAAAFTAVSGIEPAVGDELGEVDLGSWEGHGIHHHGANGTPEFAELMAGGRWDVIPGAEPHDAWAARVRRGLEAAADHAEPGRPLAVFTHAGVIAELMAQLTGGRAFAFVKCANGSLSRVVRQPDGTWELVTFNDVVHLG